MNWGVYQTNARKLLLGNYAWNACANHERIMKMFEKENLDASTLPRANRALPAIVVGSGPSLDLIVHRLREWRGVIFAPASQLSTLEYWGVSPQYIVVVDSADSVATQLSGYVHRDSVLLTHPFISPKVFDVWKWTLKLFRIEVEGEWYEAQRFTYPWVTSALAPLGCVATTCVQIAHDLGYSPIVLAGVDFAFADDGRIRALGHERRGTYIWSDSPSPIYEDRSVLTSNEMFWYKLMMLALWKTHKMRLLRIKTESRTILDEPQGVTIAEAINLAWPPVLEPNVIEDRCDRTLKENGVNVVLDGHGSSRIEYEEAKKEETPTDEHATDT